MINLRERMLQTSAGLEPTTSWSPVGRRIQLSHLGRHFFVRVSPETDNCPSWISGRERMTVENISWSISIKVCCRPRQELNPRPPGLQLDSASNWATEAGAGISIWDLSCEMFLCVWVVSIYMRCFFMYEMFLYVWDVTYVWDVSKKCLCMRCFFMYEMFLYI